MERFLERHRGRILGVLSSFDRILFRGTLRSISYREGFDRFLGYHGINPANKLIRKRKDLAVAEEATIVNGIGAIACLVRSGIVGSKESSDGHRVTRWTL